jgi:hypothetical protein
MMCVRLLAVTHRVAVLLQRRPARPSVFRLGSMRPSVDTEGLTLVGSGARAMDTSGQGGAEKIPSARSAESQTRSGFSASYRTIFQTTFSEVNAWPRPGCDWPQRPANR